MDDSSASATHLKDFRLAIEYKYLMRNAPGGVFLMPEFDDIRQLNGVIFVRRGLYRNGIFRFRMTLPKGYNALNAHPSIAFTPPIFNPLVDPETGVLDLRLDESLKEWNPEKNFLVSALTFLKKIFYMKSFDNFPVAPNERAKQMLTNDKEAFLKEVEESVLDSLKRVHEMPQNGTIVFTEPKPAHENIRRQVYGRTEEEGGGSSTGSGSGIGPGSPPVLPAGLRSNEAEDAADKEEAVGVGGGVGVESPSREAT